MDLEPGQTVSVGTFANAMLSGDLNGNGAVDLVVLRRPPGDDKVVILVPETDGSQVRGLLLLHVSLKLRVSIPEAEQALAAYRGRLSALMAAVTETEPKFDRGRLAALDVAELLMFPIQPLSEAWTGV